MWGNTGIAITLTLAPHLAVGSVIARKYFFFNPKALFCVRLSVCGGGVGLEVADLRKYESRRGRWKRKKWREQERGKERRERFRFRIQNLLQIGAL